MTAPINPRKYIGPNQYLTTNVTRNREPTGADVRQPETGKNYLITTLWQVGKNPTTGAEGEIWCLTKIVANVAYWEMISGAGGTVIGITVDAFTPPGTNPVIPAVDGLITITGAQVSPGDIGANVIRTNSLSPNTFSVEIQQTSTNVSKDTTLNGVSHFNSEQFTNDQGFVSMVGGSGPAILSIALQSGTSPIIPNGSGQITLNASVVAATMQPIITDGTDANTANIEVQVASAIDSTDASYVGLAAFDSADFNVDANGFVSLVAGAFSYTNVTFGMSPYTVLNSDQYISCDTSGGAITLLFPNAPAQIRSWIVKDRTGNATINPITITTVGGAVNIDGATTYIIGSNRGSIDILTNLTTYEIY